MALCSCIYTVVLLFLLIIDTNGQTVLRGGVVTRNDVQEYADFALDIDQIRKYGNDVPRIRAIYEDGMNVERDGHKLALKSLVQELVQDQHYVSTPNALFFDHGVRSAFQLDQPHFASDTVENVINGVNPELSADAILSLVIWHVAAEILWTGVRTCHQKTQADNPDFVTGSTRLDEFVALWLGQEDAESGTTLYSWAENAAGTISPGVSRPEATVNTNIKLLYQQGAALLAVPSACTKDNQKSFEILWNVVVRMTSEMMIPLFQWLFFCIEGEHTAMAQLYASALIPHVSRCQASLFKRLSWALTSSVSVLDKRRLVVDLQDAASRCFGFTCHQIFSIKENLECVDQGSTLAGFSIRSARDRSLARIDMDIHALQVLGQSDFSKYVYKNGWNVPLHRESENDPFALASLSAMANQAARSVAARTFLAYFNVNDYAEKFYINPVYSGTSKWKSVEQQAEVIALTSAYHIVYLETISNLYDVSSDCQNLVDLSVKGNALDRAAALLIGSFEGGRVGGSPDFDDGLLLWHLGNRKSFQFETMNQGNYANINQDIIDLLNAARGEQDAGVCVLLEKTMSKILNLTQVAILQSIVGAAIENEHLEYDSTSTSLVHGEVLAMAVVPFIDQNHAPSAAQKIRENMEIIESVKPVHDGYKEVQRLITEYVEQTLGLSACRYLGRASSLECTPSAAEPQSSSRGYEVLHISLVLTTTMVSMSNAK